MFPFQSYRLFFPLSCRLIRGGTVSIAQFPWIFPFQKQNRLPKFQNGRGYNCIPRIQQTNTFKTLAKGQTYKTSDEKKTGKTTVTRGFSLPQIYKSKKRRTPGFWLQKCDPSSFNRNGQVSKEMNHLRATVAHLLNL